jgi:hypothetical protein
MQVIETDTDLNPETKLYRYVSLGAFLAFIETKRSTLTNVNSWDDKWEVILSKIPTVDDQGRPDPPLYSFHQEIFGQCWSLVEESDAMWRIYSPGRNGLRLQSTVAKFNLIGGMKRAHLGKVVYFETVKDLLAKAKPRRSSFHAALFKRVAFQHEQEVRLLTHSQFLDHFEPGSTQISLPVDPSIFIEGITIDPRAENWYVAAIRKYAERVGLPFTPVKSALYETDPHLKLGLVGRYVPVQDDE